MMITASLIHDAGRDDDGYRCARAHEAVQELKDIKLPRDLKGLYV